MKNIKLFVYGVLYSIHSHMMYQYKDWFEQASMVGDHKEMAYCDKRLEKHYKKCEKYWTRAKEIENLKKGA